MRSDHHRWWVAAAFVCTALMPLSAQTDSAAPATNAAPDNSTNQAPTYFAPSPAALPSTAPAVAPVPVNPAPSGLQDDIDDIRPPYFYLHSWFWLWSTLGIFALIALAILLWRLFRPQRQLSPKTAYELALEKLEQARALLREDQAMPYAVAVSETIRSYLSQRFQSPSTRRTTEEFLRIMEVDPAAHLAEHRDLLRGFLQSCDLVKFARYQPTLAELDEVQQSAFRFVTATKPAAQNGVAPS
jgi:hypothetical protein